MFQQIGEETQPVERSDETKFFRTIVMLIAGVIVAVQLGAPILRIIDTVAAPHTVRKYPPVF